MSKIFKWERNSKLAKVFETGKEILKKERLAKSWSSCIITAHRHTTLLFRFQWHDTKRRKMRKPAEKLHAWAQSNS